MQPAGALLVGEHRDDGGVAAEALGLEGVERGDELVDRLPRVEAQKVPVQADVDAAGHARGRCGLPATTRRELPARQARRHAHV